MCVRCASSNTLAYPLNTFLALRALPPSRHIVRRATDSADADPTSAAAAFSAAQLHVAVSMSRGDWTLTDVHVVTGMDVTTQEACSVPMQDDLVMTSCVPIAVIVGPASTPASRRRAAAGTVDGAATPTDTPSPGTCCRDSYCRL